MSTIPPSELILNSRGAVYHLDLLPEEIAQQIILVGDPDRVSEVSRHFDRVEFRRQTREFITHTGYIGEKRLSVSSTGIGTDNIDIVLNELDALVNIDLHTGILKNELTRLQFFRVGTSGSLREEVAVDSILVSTHGIGLDNLLNFYTYAPAVAEQQLLDEFNNYMLPVSPLTHPYIAAGSARLAGYFAGHAQGITVTCPGFYGPQGRVLRGPLAQPGMIDRLTHFGFNGFRITNFEMETAGIYGLSSLLGHEAISLNAILANRVTKEFSKDPKKVVERLIGETLEVMTKISCIQ